MFLAENIRTEERCIIKKIRKNHPFFQQISKEVYFLRLLKSKFLPQLYDVEEDDDALYILTEFLEGYHPSQEEKEKETLRDEDLLFFLLQLSEFLSFLQNREVPVLYLDWKPENMLITEEGLKVIDFGSAILLGEEDKFPALTTKEYSAPEIRRGEEIGTFTDIYGFGCLIKTFAGWMKEGRGFYFRKSKKKHLLELAEKCMRDMPEKRCTYPEIKKSLAKLISGQKKRNGKTKQDIRVRQSEKTIGVCGTFHGCGVSYTALQLTRLLLRQKKRVALVFYTHFSEMDAYLTCLQKKEIRLDVFENVTRIELIPILNKKYHHVIIDFGLLKDGILEEFLRCEKKITVVHLSVLKREKEYELLKKFQKSLTEGESELILNLSDGKRRNQEKKELLKMGISCKLAIQPSNVMKV